jgi:hypothetical protein
MSYMRGDYYVWHDGLNVHLWAVNGNDGWAEANWACDDDGNLLPERRNASGVGIPEPVLDELVMMRLAELLEEQSAVNAIERAITKHDGNGGCQALAKYAALLKACIHQIQLAQPNNAA